MFPGGVVANTGPLAAFLRSLRQQIRGLQLATPLGQEQWCVSTSGNDNAAGTFASPIRSLEQLYRRTAGRFFPSGAEILLDGDFSAESLVLDCALAPGKTITVRGTTRVDLSGTITSHVGWNAATATQSVFTADADFSAHVGKNLVILSGPAEGASSFIAKVLGPGQVRPGVFSYVDGYPATPTAGDAFSVEELTTKIGGLELDVRGNGGDMTVWRPRVLVRDLEITNPLQDLILGFGQRIGTYLYRVRLTGLCIFRSCVVTTIGCYNKGAMLINRGSQWLPFGHLSGHVISLSGLANNDTSDLIFQGPLGGLSCELGGVFDTTKPVGFFDIEGTECLLVEQMGCMSAASAGAILWGAGNTAAYGVRVRAPSIFEYVTKPSISGVADCLIGGNVKTWGEVPFLAPQNGAGIVVRT